MFEKKPVSVFLGVFVLVSVPIFGKTTLTKNEAKLHRIFTEVDADQDNAITEQELEKYLKKTDDGLGVVEESEFLALDKNGDGLLTWEEYKPIGEMLSPSDGENFLNSLKILWKESDKNQDSMLDVNEGTMFLRNIEIPGEKDYEMEAIKDELKHIDKDSDGLISLDEYLDHMVAIDDTDKEEREREVDRLTDIFENRYDRDENDFLDKTEAISFMKDSVDPLKDIPVPENMDKVEATFLVQFCDKDKDSKLTSTEFVSCDVVSSSKITNFGEALHDEL